MTKTNTPAPSLPPSLPSLPLTLSRALAAWPASRSFLGWHQFSNSTSVPATHPTCPSRPRGHRTKTTLPCLWSSRRLPLLCWRLLCWRRRRRRRRGGDGGPRRYRGGGRRERRREGGEGVAWSWWHDYLRLLPAGARFGAAFLVRAVRRGGECGMGGVRVWCDEEAKQSKSDSLLRRRPPTVIAETRHLCLCFSPVLGHLRMCWHPQ